MKAITFALLVWISLILAIQFLECKFTEPVSLASESLDVILPPGNSEISGKHSLSDAKSPFPESFEPESEKPASSIPWSNSVLALLKKSECATCHTQSLPTAKEGALAIFNLEEIPWYARLKEENLSGLSKRILGNTKFPLPEQEALKEFINCFQRKDCKSES